MNIKSTIYHNFLLIPGWRTSRKIVAIESDDWGSIRIPDNNTITALSKSNPFLKNDIISQIDTLESNEDLTALFDVLQNTRDKNNKPAVITANTIVANPDFDRISACNFTTYYYEYFTETLKRYQGRDKVKALIKQGIDAEIYQPQFHGREHVNVFQWLDSLQKGNKILEEAFNYRASGVPINEKGKKKNNFMAALDFEENIEKENHKAIIREGTSIFEELFGFRSKSFIATSYIWDSEIEETLYQNGIRYLQGIPYQYIPKTGASKYDRKFHFTGQKNKYGQLFLTRNAFFEPSLSSGTDVVAECLYRIELAFKWNKPAIIGSHRVNFIGSLKESNRSNNLKLLAELLKKIISRWPDVEFMSSDQLGDIITNE